MGVYEGQVSEMYNRTTYIMWYQGLFGNSKKAKKALEHYGGFEKLYEVVTKDDDTDGLLKGFSRQRLTSFSLFDALDSIETARDIGGDVITFESPYYPEKLLETADYPFVLFYQGDKEVLTENVHIAMVGARKTPEEALALSYSAAYNLAKTGAVIVSGAALGVDTAAHKGAIAAGGATVGVLGCGLGNEYMERIGNFYGEVCRNGVYITEMLPFEAPSKFTFPERNRIISGMSDAVLVTYAGEKSGSLITAGTAKKQKRRVYAVAERLCSSDGCKKLIAEGASVFYNAGDIAYPLKEKYGGKFNENYCNAEVCKENVPHEAYSLTKEEAEPVTAAAEENIPAKKTVTKKAPSPVKEEKKPKEIPDYVSAEAKKIYSVLTEGKTDVNNLVDITGLPVRAVLTAVSELEIFGLIRNLPGAAVEII